MEVGKKIIVMKSLLVVPVLSNSSKWPSNNDIVIVRVLTSPLTTVISISSGIFVSRRTTQHKKMWKARYFVGDIIFLTGIGLVC